jgi:hypothetical protein
MPHVAHPHSFFFDWMEGVFGDPQLSPDVLLRFLPDAADVRNLRLTCRTFAMRFHRPRASLVPFDKMRPAYEYAQQCRGLRVWARDLGSAKSYHTGTLATWLRTMEWYRRHNKEICYYEILHSPDEELQSASWTSPYMDLDLSRKYLKHGVPDAVVVSTMVRRFVRFLQRELGSDDDEERTVNVRPIILTAHSAQKFSVHIVFRLSIGGRAAVFPDNFSVGALVRKFEHEVEDEIFYFINGDGDRDCIIDPGVYTLRRQFRTAFSNKTGEERPLVPLIKNLPLALTLVQYHDHGTSWDFDSPPPLVLEGIAEVDGSAVDRGSKNWDDMQLRGKKRGGSSGLDGGRPTKARATCEIPVGRQLMARCAEWLVSLEEQCSLKDVVRIDDKLCRFTLHGDCVCKRRGRRHLSNEVYYTIKLGDLFALQHCRDRDCIALGQRVEVEMPLALKRVMMMAVFFGNMVEEILIKH